MGRGGMTPDRVFAGESREGTAGEEVGDKGSTV